MKDTSDAMRPSSGREERSSASSSSIRGDGTPAESSVQNASPNSQAGSYGQFPQNQRSAPPPSQYIQTGNGDPSDLVAMQHLSYATSQRQAYSHPSPIHQTPSYGPTYVSQSSYYSPSSPSEMHRQYAHPMGEVPQPMSYGNMGQEMPPRTVSPSGSQAEAVQADAYYMAFPPNSPSGQQQYFVQPGAPSPSGAFPPAQYPQNVYGMSYYGPSYTQAGPTYYSPPQASGGWVAAPPPQHQQSWRPPGYYQYGNPTGPHAYGRPQAIMRSRHPSGLVNTIGSGGGSALLGGGQNASRSASSPSRTSPNSLTEVQKNAHSSNSSRTAPSSTSEGATGVSDPTSGSKSVSSGQGVQASQGQGPRSEFVLWCGNVPADATVDELWSFFTKPVEGKELSESDPVNEANIAISGEPVSYTANGLHGVLSIFVISRSNCAFVNYDTAEHLQHALEYFQGLSIRPYDPRCPKLVCRVRKKDDEAQAGVAGQRGKGIHVAWLKEQERKAKEERIAQQLNEPGAEPEYLVAPQARRTSNVMGMPSTANKDIEGAIADPSPESAATPTPQNNAGASLARPSIDHSSSGSGSISYASTNSSLFRHPAFRERFFILKSLRAEDLDESVKTGLWATQGHNEAVLDQAYRNSEQVYLIFSANQSGGFYGYARMASAIQATPSGATDKTSNSIRPTSIPEHEEDDSAVENNPTGHALSLPGHAIATLSPQQLTPSTDSDEPILPTSPAAFRSGGQVQLTSGAATLAPTGIDSNPRSQSTLIPDDKVTSSSLGAVPSIGPRVRVESPAASMPANSPMEATSTMPKEESTDDEQVISGTSIGSTSSEPMRARPPGLQSPSSSDAASLAPSESASYPADTRSQGQLAIRALIHNLRLDEKESVHRAKQLEAIEAEMREKEAAGAPNEEVEQTTLKAPQPLASSPETWGKPFKVEWLKVQPLDFQRVRRLRNPWRDNRQVKVSRDGTELEPNVGRQMLEEWNKEAPRPAKDVLLPSNSNRSMGSSMADEEEDETES